MYAIVETGGKQYKLEEGRYVDIELLDAQADEKVKIGDLIWVEGYTREDGTKVCGYYRRK